jgi:hypothetical protein
MKDWLQKITEEQGFTYRETIHLRQYANLNYRAVIPNL